MPARNEFVALRPDVSSETTFRNSFSTNAVACRSVLPSRRCAPYAASTFHFAAPPSAITSVEDLQGRGDPWQPVEAWPALTGRLGGQVPDDAGGLAQAAPVGGERGQDAGAQ